MLINVKNSIVNIIKKLDKDEKKLINTSFYPLLDFDEAYKNNVKKIIYSLVRWPDTKKEHLLFDKLWSNYKHRNWNHEYSSLSAGIQPWNSIDINNFSDIWKVLKFCSPLSKFISENWPYYNWNITEINENRNLMYDKNKWMLASSIYKSDKKLLDTLSLDEFEVTNYIDNLFKNSYCSFIWNKNWLFAFKKVEKIYNLLENENIELINLNTLEEIKFDNLYKNISFNDLFESTLYFPDFKLRIVWWKEIMWDDFKKLIYDIKYWNELDVINMFNKFDIKFAIEWRNYSTVLPDKWDYTLTFFPFILQSLVIQNFEKINSFILIKIERDSDNIFDLKKDDLFLLIDIIFSNLNKYNKEELSDIQKVKEIIIKFLESGENKWIRDKNKYWKNINEYLLDNLIKWK